MSDTPCRTGAGEQLPLVTPDTAQETTATLTASTLPPELTVADDTPIAYVAHHRRVILGIFGKGGDAETAVKAHREMHGHAQTEYAIYVVPFFGRLWRRGQGECDE